MRIIGGKLKGKKLFFLESLTTRPLRDMVKESIFNIIEHSNILKIKIENSNILDLYSGTGSFGIECLSRNAQSTTFIENEMSAIRVLKKNLQMFNLEGKSDIYTNEITRSIKKLKIDNFDIIFLDPPFADENYKDILKIIKETRNFKKDQLIILHRDISKKESLEEIIKILMIKEYGRSKIIFGVF